MKVLVVGAGVSGLATALKIRERMPAEAVTVDVVAEHYSPNTTSDRAGGESRGTKECVPCPFELESQCKNVLAKHSYSWY